MWKVEFGNDLKYYPDHSVYTVEWELNMHAWHGETLPEWPSISAHFVWLHRDWETGHAIYSVPPPSQVTKEKESCTSTCLIQVYTIHKKKLKIKLSLKIKYFLYTNRCDTCKCSWAFYAYIFFITAPLKFWRDQCKLTTQAASQSFPSLGLMKGLK